MKHFNLLLIGVGLLNACSALVNPKNGEVQVFAAFLCIIGAIVVTAVQADAKSKK